VSKPIFYESNQIPTVFLNFAFLLLIFFLFSCRFISTEENPGAAQGEVQ
jgi:hypothetical protein